MILYMIRSHSITVKDIFTVSPVLGDEDAEVAAARPIATRETADTYTWRDPAAYPRQVTVRGSGIPDSSTVGMDSCNKN